MANNEPCPVCDRRDRVKLCCIGVGQLHPGNDHKRAASAMLGELMKMTHYAQCALDQFKNGRGHLDITGFNVLIPDARATIALAEKAGIRATPEG